MQNRLACGFADAYGIALYGTYYLDETGDINIEVRDGYHYVNGVKDDDGWVIIKNSQDETKTGPVDSTVTINTNKDQTADITLDNVNIDVSDRERCRLDREG